MKMYQHVLSFMAGSLLLGAQGFAGVYLLKVNNYPVGAPAGTPTCMQEAQTLGDRLASVTNVKINRVYCGPVSRGANDLNVVYEAPQPLTTIDSVNHNTIDHGIGQGIYETWDECQKDLGDQQTEFATMTGSHVVAAFCSKEWFDSSHPYSPIITAIVMDPEPHPHLMFMTQPIFGRAPDNAGAVAQAFADKLRAAGVHVRKVVLADDAADSRLQVSYYGTEPLQIDVEQKLAFENDAACQSRSAPILAALGEIGVQLYASFCSADEYSHSTKFYTIGYMPAKEVLWTAAPGVYPTRKDCEDDQEHIEDIYRQQGVAVSGSVCAYRTSYQLLVLSAP